jgi:hypothetical protein
MPEIKKEVYEVRMLCDTCGVGEMKSIGAIFDKGQKKELHVCSNDKCRAHANLDVSYPYYTPK